MEHDTTLILFIKNFLICFLFPYKTCSFMLSKIILMPHIISSWWGYSRSSIIYETQNFQIWERQYNMWSEPSGGQSRDSGGRLDQKTKSLRPPPHEECKIYTDYLNDTPQCTHQDSFSHRPV
jgi:hypothetical protein